MLILVLGVAGPALLAAALGALQMAIPFIGFTAGIALLGWGVSAAIKEEKAKDAKRKSAFDYWFYHRPTDTWIPANGPHSFRLWWSLDWSRWLTRDEVESRIPFTEGFNARLKVYDGRQSARQVWRDECEVWTIHPALNKRTVTSIAKDDIQFMNF